MKTLRAGTLVVVNGRTLNIKEYVGAGVYQGNDIVTSQLIHFNKSDIHSRRVVKRKKK